MDPLQGKGKSLVTFSIVLFLVEFCLILEGIFSILLMAQDWNGQDLWNCYLSQTRLMN